MKLKQALEIVGVALRNIVLGGNLISLSLINKPRKMVEYISENLFLYKGLNSKRGIPQRNVFEVLATGDVEDIKLGSLKSDENWIWAQSSFTADLVNVCLICKLIRPKVVFEIGTLKGYTSFHFALNTPDDSKIYTLDLPKEKSVEPALHTTLVDDFHIDSVSDLKYYCFEGNDAAKKIECLSGDTATFDFSPYFGKVDFFFIDGAHSYEYVKSDTLNALKCCHPGSVIAWHDFGRVGVNGVVKWILELSKTREIYSVPGGSIAFMVVK